MQTLATIALTMSAQDFHGVSISGTNAPTITNNSTKPLMGLVLQRLDTNAVNPTFHDVDYGRMITGQHLQPGESTTHMLMGMGTFGYSLMYRDTRAGQVTVM